MIFSLEKIRAVFLLIPLVLFIHEMEEWNIHNFHKKNYSNNNKEETVLSVRLWLIFLSLFGFLWTLMCYYIPNLVIGTVLMMLLIDFTILNSIQHIGLTIKTRKYNPGLIFGGFIGMSAAVIVIQNIMAYKIIPKWSVIILLGLVIPFIVETIIKSKKNELPKMIEWILKFSLKLEMFLTK